MLQENLLEVGAEDVMAMLDLIDDGGELAGQPCRCRRAPKISVILWAVNRLHRPSSQPRSNSLWMESSV